MANTQFYVPRLKKEGAWLDWRGRHRGGKVMYGDRALSNIRYAAVHHSVTHPTGNAAKDVDTLASIHIDGNGWLGIGYHFIVTSEVTKSGFAKVAYVGDIGTIRAHTPNTKGAKGLAPGFGNHYIVAACMIGMNHLEMPSTAQLRSMKLLMQELLWFENQRLPNLANTWSDMQPHKVFDYTQCNGMDKIMSAIKNASIPTEIVKKPVPASTKLSKPIKFKARLSKTQVWDLETNPDYKSVKTLKKGDEFIAFAKINFNSSTYYVTEYSHTNKNKHGVNAADLEEVKAPTPTPAPKPIEEKPIVRAMGAVKEVFVKEGSKVVDVITGKVTREYTENEPFEATHTIDYKGKNYFMTLWSFQQYEKGKNPTGIDSTTVEAMIKVPEPDPVADPDLPPHEPTPPLDPDLVDQHEKDIADLKSRMNLVEKALQAISDFLGNLFKNFK